MPSLSSLTVKKPSLFTSRALKVSRKSWIRFPFFASLDWSGKATGDHGVWPSNLRGILMYPVYIFTSWKSVILGMIWGNMKPKRPCKARGDPLPLCFIDQKRDQYFILGNMGDSMFFFWVGIWWESLWGWFWEWYRDYNRKLSILMRSMDWFEENIHRKPWVFNLKHRGRGTRPSLPTYQWRTGLGDTNGNGKHTKCVHVDTENVGVYICKEKIHNKSLRLNNKIKCKLSVIIYVHSAYISI